MDSKLEDIVAQFTDKFDFFLFQTIFEGISDVKLKLCAPIINFKIENCTPPPTPLNSKNYTPPPLLNSGNYTPHPLNSENYTPQIAFYQVQH